MQYRQIKSLAQYKSYENYLEKLLWVEDRSATEQNAVEQLISLIVEWDRKNGSSSAILPKPTPVNALNVLENLMKKHKMSSAELATLLGESQSGISDILNSRRELTPDMLLKISERFGVVPEIFSL